MGKSLVLFSSVALALSSCSKPEPDFSATLTGVDSDTLLVFVEELGTRKFILTDTVPVKENRFEVQLPDSALYIRFVPKPKSASQPIRMFQQRPLMYFPGDKMKVEGDVSNFKAYGTPFYDDLARYEEVAKLEAEIRKLNGDFNALYKAKKEAELAENRKQVVAAFDRLYAERMKAIKANPNSLVAGYFAVDLSPEQGLEAIELLSDEVKNGPLASIIKNGKESYERRIIIDKAKENMKPGMRAPEFKLKTLEGKEVTLDTFKGKYLLMDFWGTWCGWCIKGIPQMKKYYEKYGKKMEILGVSCKDTEAGWRNGVARHKLPWVNVHEGDSNIWAHYAVTGFPTKVLIDAKGNIVRVFVGETPELYKELDRLFGK